MISYRLSPLVVHHGFVYGWGIGAEGPLPIHLYVDGRHIATEFTGQALPSEVLAACGEPPEPHAGFAFPLPASVLDGFAHDLHVAVPTPDGEGMYGEVISYAADTIRGQILQKARTYVGTVWVDNPFEEVPPLEVIDGAGRTVHVHELSFSVRADQHGYPGEFSVPCSDLPEGPLRFMCGSRELNGSPLWRQQALLGMLEEVSVTGVRGWAFDAADVLRPIELVLRVDGKDEAWFRPNMRRDEIARHLHYEPGDFGLVGFQLPLPESARDEGRHLIEVASAATGKRLRNGEQWVQVRRPWVEWKDLARARRNFGPAGEAAAASRSATPKVSVVILNRNGRKVLQELLQSWLECNRTVLAEVIVVDHASTDGSLQMLERWSSVLDLRVIALDHNGSFSESSNLGAQHARGEFVLFLNNDIMWLQDALPRMLESFEDADVGIVGIKLLKVVGETPGGRQFASEVQHLGVRFKLNDLGYWPYEVAVNNSWNELEYAPQEVPVVTGAALLCRRSDFEAAGGFDTGYFYGFEDVELCLRLSQRIGRRVVCRNDCVALHHHGHTRLSGRERSIFDRLIRNSAVLERHIGLWIKQAYWRSLVQGDGFITREPLTIGLVVDAPAGVQPATPLVEDGMQMARRISARLPHARVVLLEPGLGWKDVPGVHVLLVGDARYDIRSLREARPDLLVVGWLRGSPRVWRVLPWWDEFDAVLPRKGHSREEPLGPLLGASNWRTRVAVHAAAPKRSEEAKSLRASLKADGVPCWIDGPRRMADICVTLVGPGVRLGKLPLRTDVLNVVWIPENARGPARVPEGVVVTRHAPTALWLQQQMEIRVGSTFSPP